MAGVACEWGGKATAEIPLGRNLSAEQLTCAGGMLELD